MQRITSSRWRSMDADQVERLQSQFTTQPMTFQRTSGRPRCRASYRLTPSIKWSQRCPFGNSDRSRIYCPSLGQTWEFLFQGMYLSCNKEQSSSPVVDNLSSNSIQLCSRVCGWSSGRSKSSAWSSAGDPIEPSGDRYRHNDAEYDDNATDISDLPEKGSARRIGVSVSNYLQTVIMDYHNI